MPKDDIKLPELLTIAQVAKILNVHATTLRRWDKKGKLKAIRVGTRRGVGERRYHREDIIKLITKYQIRSESRIFKLKKIQREYQLKLNSFNSQGVFKLDFSAFETMEIAKKVIFGSLFSISKSVSSLV